MLESLRGHDVAVELMVMLTRDTPEKAAQLMERLNEVMDNRTLKGFFRILYTPEHKANQCHPLTTYLTHRKVKVGRDTVLSVKYTVLYSDGEASYGLHAQEAPEEKGPYNITDDFAPAYDETKNYIILEEVSYLKSDKTEEFKLMKTTHNVLIYDGINQG